MKWELQTPDWVPLGEAGFVGQTFNLRLCDVVGFGYELGLEDYPIWDESKREWLNNRLVQHFYLREIGCETATQFVFYLNRKMAEVMPWLNVVFASAETFQTAQDLLNNEEIRIDRSGAGTNQGKSDSTSDATSRAYSSNDPTVSMVGRDEVRFYDTGNHSDSAGKGSSESSGQHDFWDTEHRKGHYGRTLTGALAEYVNEREVNALELLFEKLEPLFCQVLDIPDSTWLDMYPTWLGPWRYGYPFGTF